MKRDFTQRATWVIGVMGLTALLPALSFAQEEVSADLTDTNPMVRLVAVQKVEREKTKAAEPILATIVKEDTFDVVREAACKALQAIGATEKIDLLVDVSQHDANADVRVAASSAVTSLRLQITDRTYRGEIPNDRYEKPTLTVEKVEPRTRYLGLGLGIMGGYGLVTGAVRGRIPTAARYLPFVGIELGGGWTPPSLYVVTAGPIGDINNEDYKWKIISGAASVLFYFHRMHYAALRGGFDIGRGPYGVLDYGFELPTEDGFFSWGVEAGILIQPGIDRFAENLVECDDGDSCFEETWPVIPCVRFSIHFYPI